MSSNEGTVGGPGWASWVGSGQCAACCRAIKRSPHKSANLVSAPSRYDAWHGNSCASEGASGIRCTRFRRSSSRGVIRSVARRPCQDRWRAQIPLNGQAVGDLEPIMVDQPADAVQHRRLGFKGRGVAEQRARFVDRGVLTTRQVLPAGVGVLRGGG